MLHKSKEKPYKFSDHLNEIDNIQGRIMITKLGTGCTKLKSHRFLGKNEMDNFPLCKSKSNDTLLHILFECNNEDLTVLRNVQLNKIIHEYPNFKNLQPESKLYSIYNLQSFDNSVTSLSRYKNTCINLINEILKFRFKND